MTARRVPQRLGIQASPGDGDSLLRGPCFRPIGSVSGKLGATDVRVERVSTFVTAGRLIFKNGRNILSNLCILVLELKPPKQDIIHDSFGPIRRRFLILPETRRAVFLPNAPVEENA